MIHNREYEKVAEVFSKGFPALDSIKKVKSGLLIFGLENEDEGGCRRDVSAGGIAAATAAKMARTSNPILSIRMG